MLEFTQKSLSQLETEKSALMSDKNQREVEIEDILR
jgi:hypothetical protein